MLTAERLREVLSYDPETGIFRWLVATNKRIRVGAVAGCVVPNGYLKVRVDDHLYLAHRLAWFYVHGEWPETTDHVNGDRLDNRIANLRSCTQAENSRNQRGHSRRKSQFKGVSFTHLGKPFARICVEGRRISLGSFETEAAAGAAYDAAAHRLHGEFARTNGG